MTEEQQQQRKKSGSRGGAPKGDERLDVVVNDQISSGRC